MTIGKLYAILDEISPFNLQEKWDNSGLLVGSMNDTFNDIILSIDIDHELIDNAKNNSIIITHHPLLFAKENQFISDKFPANIIKKMIKKDLTHIALHTNFDKTHLNDYIVEEILEEKIIDKDNFITYFEINKSFKDLVKEIKEKLNISILKTVQCHENITRVALVTGSGASLINDIKADIFLTGDIKYHDAMLAKMQNLSLIDIGHYESEYFFSQILAKELKHKELSVIISSSKNPFTIY
jgi:dinuclear metal center YbgI/SA1388 family protein